MPPLLSHTSKSASPWTLGCGPNVTLPPNTFFTPLHGRCVSALTDSEILEISFKHEGLERDPLTLRDIIASRGVKLVPSAVPTTEANIEDGVRRWNASGWKVTAVNRERILCNAVVISPEASPFSHKSKPK